MKIIIEKQELLRALTTVSSAVPSKTTMPILECILIEATDTKVSITATDLAVGIKTIVSGTIDEAGSVAIDAKIIMEIVKRMPNNDIVIKTEGTKNQISISCENADFCIACRDADEYPNLPELEIKKEVTVNQTIIRDMIRQTAVAVSEDEQRKMMTGISFKIADGVLRTEAVDGFKLAIREEPLDIDKEESISTIIPGKMMLNISRLLTDEEEPLNIGFSQNHAVFSVNDTTVITRVIDGDFFKVDQMIPQTATTTITVTRTELLNALGRAAFLSKEGDKKPLVFTMEKDGILNLKMRSSVGKMNENVSIEREGENLVIGFNPKFMIDIIKVIEDDDVTIAFSGSKPPCVIKGANYTYVLTPVMMR